MYHLLCPPTRDTHRNLYLASACLRLTCECTCLCCLVTTLKHCSVDDCTCKMRKSNSQLYFGVATAFAVIIVVCSNEWSLDSRVENELNDLVNTFHFDRVSILVLQTDNIIKFGCKLEIHILRL